MRSLVSHTKSGYPFGILEIRKNRSVGAIIAENRNKTKEKTDFSSARLQNSACAELNSAFKSYFSRNTL